jgi:hypothetical protein
MNKTEAEQLLKECIEYELGFTEDTIMEYIPKTIAIQAIIDAYERGWNEAYQV